MPFLQQTTKFERQTEKLPSTNTQKANDWKTVSVHPQKWVHFYYREKQQNSNGKSTKRYTQCSKNAVS